MNETTPRSRVSGIIRVRHTCGEVEKTIYALYFLLLRNRDLFLRIPYFKYFTFFLLLKRFNSDNFIIGDTSKSGNRHV